MKKIRLSTLIFISSLTISLAQDEWSQSALSTECLRMGVATQGSKVYFAGGARGSALLPSNSVDIYDLNTRLWSMSNMSVPREFPAGVSCGNKVMFAGGVDFVTATSFANVDIYDVQSQKWISDHLSQARFGIAALSYGNEVLFAGGVELLSNQAFATVDIYNINTGMWSSAALSEARTAMGYAVAGTKAVFAGGYNLYTVSDRVDIYDFKTGTWSIATLPLARGFASATAIGNKVIIAGGMTSTNTPTDRVDIYDVSTGIWTTSKLYKPRAFIDNAGSICGKAYFVGGGTMNLNNQEWTSASDIVDVYDADSGKWKVTHISHAAVNHSVIANRNHLLVAGGTDLQDTYMTVDINTCTLVGNDNPQKESEPFVILSNPATSYFTIILPAPISNLVISITDLSGKVIYRNDASNKYIIEVDTRKFERGLYIIQFHSKEYIKAEKIVLSR
jgi:N-acetylneuraminic acid mutarotase